MLHEVLHAKAFIYKAFGVFVALVADFSIYTFKNAFREKNLIIMLSFTL